MALMLLNLCLHAQITTIDSLHLSLDSAETLFLNHNYQLLAQKYNIESQKALVIQAKLLPNPNFSYGRGLSNNSY